jgi:hypothetical protein
VFKIKLLWPYNHLKNFQIFKISFINTVYMAGTFHLADLCATCIWHQLDWRIGIRIKLVSTERSNVFVGVTLRRSCWLFLFIYKCMYLWYTIFVTKLGWWPSLFQVQNFNFMRSADIWKILFIWFSYFPTHIE